MGGILHRGRLALEKVLSLMLAVGFFVFLFFWGVFVFAFYQVKEVG